MSGDAWPDGMSEDDRAERCVCGASAILADTEDWRSCLCLACWLAIGSPEFEPRAPLRRILELLTDLPDASEPRRARLSCGHWLRLPLPQLAENPRIEGAYGRAWPCWRCQ